MLPARVRTAHADAWAVEGALREPYGGGAATLRGIRVMASGLPHAQWNSADVTAPEADLDAARDAVRPWLAFYIGGMGSREKNFYVELADRAGHGDAARACQEAFLGGDRDKAAAALTPGLIDSMALATTPAGLDERLAAFEGIGVDTLVAVPCGSDRSRVVRTLAEATR